MDIAFLNYIYIILIIMFLVMLSDKLKIAYPIILVIAGLILGFVPGTPQINIDPQLIFLIFLPPLLYQAAWQTSWKAFWKFRRVISSFAFLIVILTSLVVAVIAHQFIPGLTLALGFLLGGIVSPPDAISATTILQRIKAPKTLRAILEGESLLNDASSLIVYRFSLATIITGQFVFRDAAISFVVVIVMGILTGIAIAVLYYLVHRWFPTTPHIDVVLTFTAPYLMYIVAEHFEFSGVLSVVSGGLFLSYRKDLILSHRSRLQGSNVWSTIGFVLNGFVFMLIGLQLPGIIAQLGPVGLTDAIKYGLLISFVLIILRLLCALGASAFTSFASRFITTADDHPGWRGPFIFGWAGMRGVVSLAAALSIPLYLPDGSLFPQRNLILFITFTVILVTLVLQGLTLPAVIRWVRPEQRVSDLSEEEQDLLVRKKIAEAAEQVFKENRIEGNILINNYNMALRFNEESANIVHIDAFKKIAGKVIATQRETLRRINKKHSIDEDIIRKYTGLLDLEEEKILVKYESAD